VAPVTTKSRRSSALGPPSGQHLGTAARAQSHRSVFYWLELLKKFDSLLDRTAAPAVPAVCSAQQRPAAADPATAERTERTAAVCSAQVSSTAPATETAQWPGNNSLRSETSALRTAAVERWACAGTAAAGRLWNVGFTPADLTSQRPGRWAYGAHARSWTAALRGWRFATYTTR
jgi:hypothetical protein